MTSSILVLKRNTVTCVLVTSYCNKTITATSQSHKRNQCVWRQRLCVHFVTNWRWRSTRNPVPLNPHPICGGVLDHLWYMLFSERRPISLLVRNTVNATFTISAWVNLRTRWRTLMTLWYHINLLCWAKHKASTVCVSDCLTLFQSLAMLFEIVSTIAVSLNQ